MAQTPLQMIRQLRARRVRLDPVKISVLGQLMPDGNWDGSFQPVVATNPPSLMPSTPKYGPASSDPWANPGAIRAFALQPDGVLVLGGPFNELNGEPRRRLARLEANGALRGVLRLHACSAAIAGGVRLELPPDAERPYRVEESAGLRTWAPLLTNATPWLPLALPAPQPQLPRQFFRAAVLP